ncbi:dnaJ homolog subfamily C member 30, mitochondrial-like [Palaemon carinicauda]|uniref:dnaJ homolog subfamily C member 30, mitochondrial-like n=1 Tax=Palaemon carinicauda TaxID=392227 RepID=UPI0035B5AAAE
MTLLGLSCGSKGKKLKKSFGELMYFRSMWTYRRNKYNLLVGDPVCVRHFSNAPKKNYYDTLGITPKATHAQVKIAYYDLSKKYHPDQNKGKDAAVKFIEIAEAYEVLGNFQKRRMYDKGVFNLGTAATPKEAEEYSSKFYDSRKNRSKMPSSSGRTPIYDFDEWSKLHYESNFDRKKFARERYEEIMKDKAEEKEERKSNAVICIILLVLWSVMFQLSHSNRVDEPGATYKKTK